MTCNKYCLDFNSAQMKKNALDLAMSEKQCLNQCYAKLTRASDLFYNTQANVNRDMQMKRLDRQYGTPVQ